jgi:hypothetical protein
MIRRLKSKEKSSGQESTPELISESISESMPELMPGLISELTQKISMLKDSSSNNFHPADGDIVYDDKTNCISIFRAADEVHQYSIVYIGIDSTDNEIYFNVNWTCPTRLANSDEISDFVLLLASKGYMWNSETKEVIEIESGSKKGQIYYFIDSQGEVTEDTNTLHKLDRLRYEFGNYFKTKEEAEEVAKEQRKRLLVKRIVDASKGQSQRFDFS